MNSAPQVVSRKSANARHRLLMLGGALLLAAGSAHATDFDPQIRITNIEVVPRDAKTATIRFDVAWGDSWRHEINHDAAWVIL